MIRQLQNEATFRVPLISITLLSVFKTVKFGSVQFFLQKLNIHCIDIHFLIHSKLGEK
jgi:hypothetical protein